MSEFGYMSKSYSNFLFLKRHAFVNHDSSPGDALPNMVFIQPQAAGAKDLSFIDRKNVMHTSNPYVAICPATV